MNRVLPISSIRFVLATWVVLSHLGLPILTAHQTGILWAARALIDSAFNGPAAVIVFFVISGFCIHFPNRSGLEVRSWKLYYARRYLRTLIPMAAALALAAPLKVPFGLFTDSVLWSLLCEEIYYFLYPGLLYLRDRIGWRYLLALAWLLSVMVLLTDPHAVIYPAFGWELNWVLGLPCWLLGCRLAERFGGSKSSPVSVSQIWIWRGGTWMLSSLALVMRFHGSIGYPWTLNLFAAFATLWLEREIRYYQSRRAPLLENLGDASYSIYLTHFSSFAILRALPGYAAMGSVGVWSSSALLCGTLATLFYCFVERPSHRLARRFTKRVTWTGEIAPPKPRQLSPDLNSAPMYACTPIKLDRAGENIN
jgi:peptidoglycan/LPS O-acetylase OafA/YrhL